MMRSPITPVMTLMALAVASCVDKTPGVVGGADAARFDGGGDEASVPATDATPEAPAPPPVPIVGWDDCGAVPVPPDATGNTPSIYGIAVSPDTRWMVVTTSRSAPMWEIADDFSQSTLARTLETELAIYPEFSPDGSRVAISGDGRILFDSATGEKLLEPTPPAVVTGCWTAFFNFSRRGRWVAGTGYFNRIDVIAVDTLTTIAELPSGSCDSGAAFSADDSLVATAFPELYRTSDWTRVWPADVTIAQPVGISLDVSLDSVSFTPDGQRLLTSKCLTPGPASRVTCQNRFFSVQTGAALGGVQPFTGPRPSFAPDGRWLVAGGDVYNLDTSQVRHLGEFTAAAFAASGDIFAAATDGNLHRLCARR